MISSVTPDASMDPWSVVPMVTGEQLLFGYAVSHPGTGGLSWVRSTPIRHLDEVLQRATTASGRKYALGRRVELRDIPAEGEEASIAFNILIGTAAKDADAVPLISPVPYQDAKWLAACKMARHLGVTAPPRTPVAVRDFLTQHSAAYTRLRNTGDASLPGQAEVASPADESEFPDLDAIVDTVPKPGPADPARVAARGLLRRALAAAGTTGEEAGRNGSVCLIVLPDVEWTQLVRDEWRALIRAGQRYEDGDRDRYHWDPDTWVAWVAKEPPRTNALKAAAELFAQAIARGAHCAGFAANVSWLPSDLVLAADHRMAIPTLTANDVSVIAGCLCGRAPMQRLSDEQAALLTPRLLRLARRLDQTADAYIVKMRHLLNQGTTPGAAAGSSLGGTATSSPRDTPTLSRLHGMDEAVEFGLGLAADLRDYKAGRLSWSQVGGHACLLSGPPGCGKTLYARALAATCDAPLISGSYSIWHSSGAAHQGDFLKAMRKSFADAKAVAPAILFVDEIDSFPDRSKVTHSYADYEIQIVNALLTEIDGVDGREGVILIAACNHPEKLDPALVRSGRLDRHIAIRHPDRVALARILREHLAQDLAGEDLSAAAMAASGSSGADCERLVRGARRRARSAKRLMVVADLLDEIGGKEGLSPGDQWIAAVHEAGHAVVTCVLWPGGLGMVSLQGSMEVGGRISVKDAASVYLRPGTLRERLVILLAGRAAEETAFGMPSSGAGGPAGSDLAQATYLVVTSLAALGLDDVSGLVWRGRPDINAIPELLATHPGLAERARMVLDDAYAAARELISSRITAVTALAQALAAQRFLDGPDAEAIVRRHSGQSDQL